ncbi:MAG: HAMP domain-containing protein [Thiotrichales bacterium]|nr:HAMP domain-containing protein [Thiotrichales bacterium]
MGIRVKLVAFLLLFGFVILGTLIWSNQFVLHKTILHYVDQRDQQRLERVKNNFEVYLQYEPIAQASDVSEEMWLRLLRFSHRVDLVQVPTMIPLVIKRDLRRRPPPLDEFEVRVSLMASSGQLLYGPPLEKHALRLPILENGVEVAQIGYQPLKELTDRADIEFSQSQFKMLSLGAVLITLLALILLWPLANHFLTPIRQLTEAMHRLSGGDLSKRLTVKRQDELGELQRDFNHLATTLEAAQHSRNQWIADISHELRTPLTVLNGSIEAMCDDVRPLNKQNLQALQQEVALLQRLIEDLYQLSLSDVGALQYAMQPLNVSTLIQQSVAQFLPKAQSKSLQLICQTESQQAWVFGDENRLSQLLNNLLSNALEYTDAVQQNGERGLVKVTLTKKMNHWQLVVEDSSPGVLQAELSQLSERFFRTDKSRNRRSGGAGLGLAMVQQIVKAHQGTLNFESSELGGLKVVVSLPMESQG